jgi:methyl-accepting chemotaxis protein
MATQADLLRQSFQEIERHGEVFIASMYARLFELYPETPHFFANTCMEEQQQKLLMSLVFVIENLNNTEYLASTLRRLGQLHSHYNIQISDFEKVGVALLDTFAEYLGPAWTADHCAAWNEIYHRLTAMMAEGYVNPVSARL